MSRFGYVMTTYVAVMLMVILSVVSFAPKLIWNASASTPIGLYAIGAPGPLEVTDLVAVRPPERSEEQTSELQSLMRTSYAVFCLKKKKTSNRSHTTAHVTP